MVQVITVIVAMLAAALTSAQAQQYPDHPVRIIVGFAAGSGPDIHARTVAAQLSTSLGQQFFVENRLGANGTIAARAVANAEPDGYTILFSSNAIASTPYIYKQLGFDIFRHPDRIVELVLQEDQRRRQNRTNHQSYDQVLHQVGR